MAEAYRASLLRMQEVGRIVGLPTDHGFVFVRSASAMPLVVRGLNPQDGSNSSSLTSTNVSVLTSPQLHTRKVLSSAGGRAPYKSV